MSRGGRCLRVSERWLTWRGWLASEHQSIRRAVAAVRPEGHSDVVAHRHRTNAPSLVASVSAPGREAVLESNDANSKVDVANRQPADLTQPRPRLGGERVDRDVEGRERMTLERGELSRCVEPQPPRSRASLRSTAAQARGTAGAFRTRRARFAGSGSACLRCARRRRARRVPRAGLARRSCRADGRAT